MLLTPSGACSSPSCLLSLGKMLLGPVELDQDPRGWGGSSWYFRKRDRQLWPESNNSRKKCRLSEASREEGGFCFSINPCQSKGEWGQVKTSMQQAWAGLCCPSKQTGRGQGTSAQGQGDQPLALPFSLGLPAIFCCLSWPPAWSRDLTVLPPPPVLWGLEATAIAGRRVWLIRRYRRKRQEKRVGHG